MRLNTLFESNTTPNDIIVLEFGDISVEAQLVKLDENSLTVEVVNEDQENIEETTQILNEFIPLLIGAASLGMSAYDAYKAYKDYKAGNISGKELAAQVGTNAALGLIGGGAAKLAARGARAVGGAVARGARNLVGRGGATAAKSADDAVAAASRQATKSADDAAAAAARKADDVTPPARQPSRMDRARRKLDNFSYNSNSSNGFGGGMQAAVSRSAMFNSKQYRVAMLPESNLEKTSFDKASNTRYWNYKVW